MAHDPRYERGLYPEDVAAEVAEILASAERDARATIEAARRAPPRDAPPSATAPRSATVPRSRDEGAPRASPPPPVDPGAELRRLVGDVVSAIASLAAQVEAIDSTIHGGFDALRHVLAPLAGAARALPGEPSEQAASPTVAGEGPAGRAERVRAIDLALRGFTRSEIAAELRGSLGEGEIERLLDDVLEAA